MSLRFLPFFFNFSVLASRSKANCELPSLDVPPQSAPSSPPLSNRSNLNGKGGEGGSAKSTTAPPPGAKGLLLETGKDCSLFCFILSKSLLSTPRGAGFACIALKPWKKRKSGAPAASLSYYVSERGKHCIPFFSSHHLQNWNLLHLPFPASPSVAFYHTPK